MIPFENRQFHGDWRLEHAFLSLARPLPRVFSGSEENSIVEEWWTKSECYPGKWSGISQVDFKNGLKSNVYSFRAGISLLVFIRHISGLVSSHVNSQLAPDPRKDTSVALQTLPWGRLCSFMDGFASSFSMLTHNYSRGFSLAWNSNSIWQLVNISYWTKLLTGSQNTCFGWGFISKVEAFGSVTWRTFLGFMFLMGKIYGITRDVPMCNPSSSGGRPEGPWIEASLGYKVSLG